MTNNKPSRKSQDLNAFERLAKELIAEGTKCETALAIAGWTGDIVRLRPKNTTAALEAAMGYVLSRSWKCFPADVEARKSHLSGDYAPEGRNWGMTSNLEQLRRNFVHPKWRTKCGVGVPTGWVNRIFDIEADTMKGHNVDGLASLQELEAKHGKLPDTLMAESPSGSVHRIYRHPGRGFKVRSNNSVIAPGVDIKGDGGMFIAPPSVRADGAYKWINNLPVADAPQWLLDLVCGDAPEQSNNGGEKDPFNEYGDEARERIPLDKLTFMLMQVIPNTPETGRAHWIKVGHALKRERPDDGKKLWLQFSNKFDGAFEGDEAKFNTDEKAWEKSVIETWNGLKPDHITGGSLYWLADAADPDWRDKYEAERMTAGVGSVEVVEPYDLWEKREAPPLPKGLLPPVIEEFAFKRAKLMGCDPAGLAMGALTVCAAAIPDAIELQSKTHDRTWKESTRIWVALGGPVSAMKSPIMRETTYPLTQIDKKLSAAYRQAKAEYEALSPEEKKNTEKPKHTRVRIEDATPEALQPILQDSPNGVLLVRDELSGWFGSMDKYSGHRGAAADRGFWLQAFNGGYYSVDRVSRGSNAIDNLSVSVLGGIQELTLRKVVEDNVDDGLVQRLFVIMLRPAVLGSDEPDMLDDQYYDLVKRLHGMMLDFSGHQLDEEAQVIRRELEQKHLDLQVAYEKINKKLAAHIGKYNGLFVRLCLLWHVIETINEKWLINKVSAETAQRVADFLHGFLLQHAIAFYVGVLGLSDQHDRLQNVADYILAHKLERITNRDVQRGDRSMRGLERAEVENIFHHLDALGWITPEHGRRHGDVKWVVNPEVHRKWAARAREEAERRAKERAEIIAGEAVARRREQKAARR